MYRLAFISFHGCPVVRLGENDTGGMNVYVLQLAKELGKKGYMVDVYTRFHDPNDPQVVQLGPGVRVIHLDAGPYGEPKASLYKHLPQFISNLTSFQESQGLNYSLVHSHYWLSGKVGIALSQKWGVPHVATFHTLAELKTRARSGQKEPRLRIKSEIQIMAQAHVLVVSSEHEKQEIAHLYNTPPHKVHVISPGVDGELFQPLDKEIARRNLGLDDRKLILYVGRVEPLKGLELLLRAFARLKGKSRARLIVIGGQEKDRELKRLKKLSAELGIKNKTSFLGTMKQEALPPYYSAADVFVLPSYYESFGLAALEAMSCGTPVVASRVGGLQSLVKDSVTGYLVPWRYPKAYTDRLDELLTDDALRDQMGKAAINEAKTMTWELTATRIIGLYKYLIEPSITSAAGD